MRVIFLIPRLERGAGTQIRLKMSNLPYLHRFADLPPMTIPSVYGGILNLIRHCRAASNAGLDAVLGTPDGKDSYGSEHNTEGLPFVHWEDRQPDDLCVLTDIYTHWITKTSGPAIAYMQHPAFLRHDFDYRDPRIRIWTDSPFMKARCQEAYPDKEVTIVPNVVDPKAFPFVPQSERTPGLIFAFPRKGPEFIDATEKEYRAQGGRYWRFERIDGLPFSKLAEAFRKPEAFLASADEEGCALPPQESMAAGILVIGKQAKGANFCMEHGKTALVAETPQEAAEALFQAEDAALRIKLCDNAYDLIKRYFPDGEPKEMWLSLRKELEGS